MMLMCLAGGSIAWAAMSNQGASVNGDLRQFGVRSPTGTPQLVGYTPVQGIFEGQQRLWMSAGMTLAATTQEQQPVSEVPAAVTTIEIDRAPRRVIRDDRPTFSAVAADSVRNEVVAQDENLFQILVYDRLDNTPPQAAISEPKRAIGGIKTKVEFNCSLYVEPKTGDIYSVNNDVVDTLVVFSRKAEGNVAPDRELETPHGSYGIAVDEENQELFLTVEHDNAVVVYRKMASKEETPIRLLQGGRTQLADPHGIAVDTRRNLVFVANHGSFHEVRADANPRLQLFGRRYTLSIKANWPLDRNRSVAGSGRFVAPSITVYARTASGNTAPIAVIQGARTQLSWPSNIAVDPERGELFVANDGGNSILVFRVSDNGNVVPLRVVKGFKTGIKNPTGVSLDTQNDELWVSNFGNHSLTVYPLTADGDTPPLRTIRAAPQGKLALGIGNPGALGYDSKRKEILVPN